MSWANKYMIIPFVEKGRSFDGADCYGLVRLIYKNELGIELPDYLGLYESTNDREKLSKIINDESSKKWLNPEKGKEKPFDVIILEMRGVPMHVGIVTKPGYMIHCAKGINTVYENYRNMRWEHKIRGFARYDNKETTKTE